MEIITHVLTNPQNLTDDRKGTARSNIDAAKKASNTTEGNLAGFDSNGELVDSGIGKDTVIQGVYRQIEGQAPEELPIDENGKVTVEIPASVDVSGKADKVSGAVDGNFAGLDNEGNLADSGYNASDFATSDQGEKADTAYQKPGNGIPKSDLDSDVQESLGKADTALQEHQDISGKADKVSGGTTGQVLTKTVNGEAWADVPKELPISGTAGQFLKKTANGVEYASVNQVPTSGMTGDVLKKTASGYEFSDVNEVPANGTEGDVLTKGAEGYSWAPRMLYKHDSKLEGDTVEITNKTITKMNIDVHSATTFNITTDDVTNMPNAIVEIFVDPGSSLTEIAFTLTWTITSGQYAGVRTLYGPASGNTVQVNAGDVIQIHIYDSCWNAFKFIQSVSPTPSYEYVVLQNFVAGHSIGTPSTGEFVTTVPDDWSSLWQADGDESMFDDTDPEAPLIDNRSPINCSKYGINSGTPVATVSCNYESESDWPWAGFDIDNGNLSYPLTEETFFTCRNSESINQHFIMILGNDRYFVEHDDTELFIGLCLSTHTYEDDEYHDENKYCRVYLTNNHLTYHRIANFNPDEVGEPVDEQGTIPAGKVSMATWLSSWHHFAFTIDASNLYVFVDGKCYATIPLSNTYVDEADTTTKTLGEWIASMPSKVCITPNEAAGSGMNMAGLWAQFAVCKACKWTTDFTVPTEAY